jgi:hypothetical protein
LLDFKQESSYESISDAQIKHSFGNITNSTAASSTVLPSNAQREKSTLVIRGESLDAEEEREREILMG